MEKKDRSKEKTSSSKMKRGHDGKGHGSKAERGHDGSTDKHNSKRIHDKKQEKGGKEISLVTLK